MSNIDRLKMIMEAINAMKSQAAVAQESDKDKFMECLENLLALENCLVSEVENLIKKEEDSENILKMS